MTTPKHYIAAATIVINDKNEILLIKGPLKGLNMKLTRKVWLREIS